MAKHQNKNQHKPAQKEESKGLIARAAEAIDHAIHPDSAPKSEPDLVESSDELAGDGSGEALPEITEENACEEKVSPALSDYEKHPKFSKFKKGVN